MDKLEIIERLHQGETFKDMTDLGTSSELLCQFSYPELSIKFGIELEGFCSLTRRQLAYEMASRLDISVGTSPWSGESSSRDTWSITTDGSIKDLPRNHPEDKGYEIVSPPLDNNSLPELKKVMSLLRNERILGDNTWKTNKSCSVHVHVSVEGLTEARKKNFYDLYRFLEPEIDKMLPDSRVNNTMRNGESYCASVTNLSYEKNRGGNHGKYWSVRVSQNIPTIEFRKHSSTSSYRKVLNWILILNRVYITSLERNNVYTLSEKNRKWLTLRNVIDNPRLIEYYNRRVQKFQKNESNQNTRRIDVAV